MMSVVSTHSGKTKKAKDVITSTFIIMIRGWMSLQVSLQVMYVMQKN